MTRKNLLPLHAALLAVALAAPCALAADPSGQSAPGTTLAALAPMPQMDVRPAADVAPFPPLEAKVREAAREGPEALRRYLHRTRMIYNYYYPDFAAKTW